jgi:hypothetical protein
MIYIDRKYKDTGKLGIDMNRLNDKINKSSATILYRQGDHCCACSMAYMG